MKLIKHIATKFTATAVVMALAASANFAAAQNRHGNAASEASALSALPIASVVILGGAASAAVAALPVALSISGAVLVVKSVELSARGTLCVLERASDGAQVSVEIAAYGVERTSLVVGKTLQVAVIGAGAVLSIAGEAIAFVPNEIGRALLHNERITN
jgi:hypothetical protein